MSHRIYGILNLTVFNHLMTRSQRDIYINKIYCLRKYTLRPLIITFAGTKSYRSMQFSPILYKNILFYYLINLQFTIFTPIRL